MDRPTRAQQRAAALDASPATLAAEVARLTRERDLARRQAELAREELQKLAGGRPGAPADGPRTATPGRGRDGGRAARAQADLVRERDEYLAALQRERAEFVNFKRRTAEEREAMLGLAAEDLIRKVLGLADDFDRAIEHRPDEGGAESSWVEGIVAIDRKLRQLLESEGVTQIEAAPGTRFDPRDHEAVANVPNTGRPGGEIVDELRRGYRLRDRVIRPALVAVAEDTGEEPSEASPAPASEHIEPIH